MSKFFKNNPFLKGVVQIVFNISVLKCVILPILNMSNTLMFFVGILLICLLITVNVRIFKKLY